MVTFSVGSLSAINAIAGMYAENVPCLVLVGAPNSNSAAEGELVHHTLGETRLRLLDENGQGGHGLQRWDSARP